VLDACAALAERLLTECANVYILATSREPLRIAGEVTWRVPSLPFPDPGRLPPLTELTSSMASLYPLCSICRALSWQTGTLQRTA
jgi:predicted ATPase